jgi:hypothetical protein
MTLLRGHGRTVAILQLCARPPGDASSRKMDCYQAFEWTTELAHIGPDDRVEPSRSDILCTRLKPTDGEARLVDYRSAFTRTG